MAEVRKSATQTAARKRAREKAATFREKQDILEQLAVDYFVATDSIETIEAETKQELAAVQARGANRLAASTLTADQVIGRMLDLGVARSEVADRLGITTRDVKKPTVSNASPFKGDTPLVSSKGQDENIDERQDAPVSV